MKTIRCVLDGDTYKLYDDSDYHTPEVGDCIRLVDIRTKETIDMVKTIPYDSCTSCCFVDAHSCRNEVLDCYHCQFQSMRDIMETI